MYQTLIPEWCLWCEGGRIRRTKCSNCGYEYGHKTLTKKQKKPKSTLYLPKVKEVIPNHIEKDKR